MGVNVLTSPTPKKIVIPNITGNQSTDGGKGKVARTIIVPKGTYSVTIQRTGNQLGGSSVSYAQTTLNNTSIVAFDAITSRPLTFYNGSLDHKEPSNQVLHIIRDSYLQIRLYTSPSSGDITHDIILEPTQTMYNMDFAFTPTNGTTPTLTGDSTNIGIGIVAMGYDYDSDSPAIITGGSAGNTGRGQRYMSSFTLWRKNASTGAWSKKTFNTDPASGYSWYQAGGIVLPAGQYGTSNGAGFFIKDNMLNNVIMEGWLTDSATNYRWGWMKASVSGASGSYIQFSPGVLDSNFGQLSSDISSGANNIMLYWHDVINKKVLYNGARSGIYNGSWSGYPWLHKWGQYDIPTATVEYSIDNGTIDHRLAGVNNEGCKFTFPNIPLGRSYAISENGSSSYLTYFDRYGNKTGVGNCVIFRPGSGNVGTALQPLTTDNAGIFINNDTFIGGSSGYVSTNLTTNRSVMYDNGNYTRLYPVYAGVPTNSSYTQILHTPNKIYTLQSGYVPIHNSDAGVPYMTLVCQLASTPMNALSFNIAINRHGGTPDATDGSQGGTNPNGTW